MKGEDEITPVVLDWGGVKVVFTPRVPTDTVFVLTSLWAQALNERLKRLDMEAEADRNAELAAAPGEGDPCPRQACHSTLVVTDRHPAPSCCVCGWGRR